MQVDLPSFPPQPQALQEPVHAGGMAALPGDQPAVGVGDYGDAVIALRGGVDKTELVREIGGIQEYDTNSKCLCSTTEVRPQVHFKMSTIPHPA